MEEQNSQVVENSKKEKILKITNFFLLMIAIGLGIYILHQEGYIKFKKDEIRQEEKTEEGDTDENDTKEEETESEYKGKYVTAKLPEGWKIEEYTGGQALTIAIKDVEYSGLTKLVISKNGVILFEMKIVDGIGLIGCPEYPKFKDFSPEVIQEIEKNNKEIGEETKYIDYTNTPYSEFSFLGTRVRRVEDLLFGGGSIGDPYFDPGCVRVIALKDISVTADYGQPTSYETSIYETYIPSNQPESDLKELDRVLESMRPV